jgi:hypothetical protein
MMSNTHFAHLDFVLHVITGRRATKLQQSFETLKVRHAWDVFAFMYDDDDHDDDDDYIYILYYIYIY